MLKYRESLYQRDVPAWSLKAGQKTEVYVYTTRIASHVGGYDEWKADITEAVEAFRRTPLCRERFGGKIPIAIRCDNSRDTELIPSDMSDFNPTADSTDMSTSSIRLPSILSRYG